MNEMEQKGKRVRNAGQICNEHENAHARLPDDCKGNKTLRLPPVLDRHGSSAAQLGLDYQRKMIRGRIRERCIDPPACFVQTAIVHGRRGTPQTGPTSDVG